MSYWVEHCGECDRAMHGCLCTCADLDCTGACGKDDCIKDHDDRYRTAMACMSRFLVWVWMEAEARRDAGTNQRKMKYWRLQVFKRWLERGMFRLEWGR